MKTRSIVKMNLVFGIIIGVGVTLFATNPEWLGGALHWAGDKVETTELVLPEIKNVDKE
jgi:hypothetical protein